MGDFVDYTVRSCRDRLGGQQGNFCGHEIGGGNRAQRDSIIIGALITHNPNALHIGQRRKILARAPGCGQLIDFLTPDSVRILHYRNLFRRNCANNTDGKPRPRERLTGDKVLRQTKFPAGLADFIFEQIPQRLHNLFEIDIIGQAADIVVTLDRSGFAAKAAFDNVGIDRALGQEIDRADLLGLDRKSVV